HPSARFSTISETQIRVPRMHGLPKHTSESMEIRLSSSSRLFMSSLDGSQAGPPAASLVGRSHRIKSIVFDGCIVFNDKKDPGAKGPAKLAPKVETLRWQVLRELPCADQRLLEPFLSP